jgi:hypothetical protein
MMRPFLVYKSNLCIQHRYLQSGLPCFHLVCLTHSAMFLFVSSPALRSTRVAYAKASSSSYFPNCDNHNFIPFQTTTTISQINNLPSPCTTYIKSVSHSIFLLLLLLSYFASYIPLIVHRNVLVSLQHTAGPNSSSYITYETWRPRTAFKISTSFVTQFKSHVQNCFQSAL